LTGRSDIRGPVGVLGGSLGGDALRNSGSWLKSVLIFATHLKRTSLHCDDNCDRVSSSLRRDLHVPQPCPDSFCQTFSERHSGAHSCAFSSEQPLQRFLALTEKASGRRADLKSQRFHAALGSVVAALAATLKQGAHASPSLGWAVGIELCVAEFVVVVDAALPGVRPAAAMTGPAHHFPRTPSLLHRSVAHAP